MDRRTRSPRTPLGKDCVSCGCGPVVTTYAPSYTTYYAPTPYVTYYASPKPYVTYYRPVTPYVTYYGPVVRPYVTYYRMPRWSFYWGW